MKKLKATFVNRFLQENIRSTISTIVISMFYIFFFGLLLYVCVASVDFYDWEMLLWGGYFYCLITSVVLQSVSVAGMLLMDNCLKNKICRVISIIILAEAFVAILIHSGSFLIMDAMEYEYRKLAYADYPYQIPLPIEFQIIVGASVAILLVVFVLRTAKAKRKADV